MPFFVMEHNRVIPADGAAWARFMGGNDTTLAEDEMGESRIRTLFLGFCPGGQGDAPMVFETWLLANGRVSVLGRYENREDACAGHLRVLERLSQPE
ncbi:MAG: hypothetical protein ABIJ95_10295, partial [Pseudomonadota bacterium]